MQPSMSIILPFDSCLLYVLLRFMTIAGQLNPPDEEVEKDDPQQQAP